MWLLAGLHKSQTHEYMMSPDRGDFGDFVFYEPCVDTPSYSWNICYNIINNFTIAEIRKTVPETNQNNCKIPTSVTESYQTMKAGILQWVVARWHHWITEEKNIENIDVRLILHMHTSISLYSCRSSFQSYGINLWGSSGSFSEIKQTLRAQFQ